MNNSIVAGAVAGFVATIPMSAAMAAMHALLPKKEQYPLPPKEITTSIAEKAGAEDLGEPEGSVLSLATHFSYGAMTGALYAPLSEKDSALRSHWRHRIWSFCLGWELPRIAARYENLGSCDRAPGSP